MVTVVQKLIFVCTDQVARVVASMEARQAWGAKLLRIVPVVVGLGLACPVAVSAIPAVLEMCGVTDLLLSSDASSKEEAARELSLEVSVKASSWTSEQFVGRSCDGALLVLNVFCGASRRWDRWKYVRLLPGLLGDKPFLRHPGKGDDDGELSSLGDIGFDSADGEGFPEG
jgi:hypothetical protein